MSKYISGFLEITKQKSNQEAAWPATASGEKQKFEFSLKSFESFQIERGESKSKYVR